MMAILQCDCQSTRGGDPDQRPASGRVGLLQIICNIQTRRIGDLRSLPHTVTHSTISPAGSRPGHPVTGGARTPWTKGPSPSLLPGSPPAAQIHLGESELRLRSPARETCRPSRGSTRRGQAFPNVSGEFRFALLRTLEGAHSRRPRAHPHGSGT